MKQFHGFLFPRNGRYFFMKNLMTRKLVFGVLIACVLALGVQGIANAQTTSVSGDTAVTSATRGTAIISVSTISATNPLERSFTLTVTGAEDGDTVTVTPADATITEIKVTSAPSDPASDPNDATDPDPSPARDEIVTSPITFGGLGTKNDGVDGTTDGDPNTASWTFKVTYTVPALGLYSIEVSGNDPSPDIQAYVVQSKGKAASYEIDKATAADITQTPQTTSAAMVVEVTDGTAVQPWVQVDLTISNGKLYPTGLFLSSSRIYAVNDASDNGYTSLSVFTGSDGKIDVTVSPNRGQTATVTAKISGTSGDHASHTVTYFYNPVTIERVSGNYQHAQEGLRLSQPLVVRVLDGTRGVGNQRVRFTASAGALRSVSSSDFIRETGSAEGTTAISVKTNSSGEAKVYLTVPNAAGLVTVNAAVTETPPAPGTTTAAELGTANQFTVFAVERDSSVLSGLTIDVVPPTPVENADPNRSAIWVGTTATVPVEVEFTVTGGQLYLDPMLQDLDAISLKQSTDRPKYATTLRLSTDASGDIGSSGSPILFVKVNSGIAVVRAEILRSSEDDAVREVQYLAGTIELEKVSNNQRVRGALGGLRSDPFVVRALIGGRPASGQIVKFTHTQTNDSSLRPVPGTKVFVTSAGGYTLDASTGPRPASGSVPVTILREETYTVASTGEPIFVETDSAGEAQVYLQMGTAAGDHTVTAALPVGSEVVSFTVQPQGGTIEGDLTKIDVPDLRPNNDKIDTLAIRAENVHGDRLPSVNIRWTTTHGTIIYDSNHGDISNNVAADSPSPAITSGQEIFVKTDSYGEVWVLYRRDPDVTNQSVRAEMASEQGTQDYDFEVTYVTFNIGSGGISGTDPDTRTTTTPYLVVSPTSFSGNPGASRSFTVLAYDANARLVNDVLVTLSATGISGLPSTVRTGQSTTFTLPSSSTTISVTHPGGRYRSTSASVSVTLQPSRLVEVSGDNQSGEPGAQLSSDFVVRVEDSNGSAVSGQSVTFAVTAGGGRLSNSSVTTGSSGEARTRLTLGGSTGTNTVEARVSGLSSVTFSATAEGGAERIVIFAGNGQSGTRNRRLPEPLIAQVVDDDDRGVEGVLVTFSVVGGVTNGRVSPIRVRTDDDGFAETDFTPRSSRGPLEIEASVEDLTLVTFNVNMGPPPDALVYISGNNQSGRPGQRLPNPFIVEVIDEDDDPVSDITVTFAVTAGGGTLSTRTATTNSGGRAQTTLTLGDKVGDNTVRASVSGVSERITFTASAGATVLVDSDKRAPMYWVGKQNGTLHRLVDGEVENLAPGVRGVTSIAVDSANDLLYFAVETGNNKGTIRRSGLNARNAQTLKNLTAVPMGIAVDSAGGTVYWTNSRGRIQSIAAEGSAKLTNLLSNLANPTAIALSNGHVYWGEPNGRVRRASLNGNGNRITPENIATGLGDPVSIAIAKGKVYWLERDLDGGGRIQRANLDGTNIEPIKTFRSGVPSSLAIDSSDNKIYWTRSTGKIQRSNLAGKFTTDIVTGLMGPGSIALGVAAAPAPVVRDTTPTTPRTPTTPTTPNNQQAADTAKYDVTGDGVVNQDDVDQVVLAVAFKSGDMKYDLNGDGVVDAKDITAVVGAASSTDPAAPSFTDVDVTRLDVTVLHEQIAVLLASGDRSIAAKQTLAYLQQLLILARPDTTALLANYPNPFNPETWIPYHLASGADVKISIYDARGTLVRELTLGHQTAGYYTSRSRAAYWDGRNAFGERVASGIYFYQLQADELSPLRKMVILK